MSVQAISWVLDHSKSTGPARLVLISVANHANDKGQAWPSVGTIAREAGISGRTVQRQLRHLVVIGELRLEEQEGRHATWLYILPALEGRQSVTPDRESPPSSCHPRQNGGGGVTPVTGGGVTTVSPKPSVRTIKEPKSAGKPRPRDEVFDALARVQGVRRLQELPKALGRTIGVARAELVKIEPGVTREEIYRRASNYRKRHPTWDLTAPALVKHWPTVEEPPETTTTTGQRDYGGGAR